MVTVQQEKSVDYESRYLYSGSGASATWTQQHRRVVTTTYRVKGTKSEVETYCDTNVPSSFSPTGREKKSYVMRKSDGPWWEADYSDTTGGDWINDSIENANSGS